MNVSEHESLKGLVRRVVGCAYQVSNTLGAGFLEKVYERALLAELEYCGLAAVPQPQITVRYRGRAVGQYNPDIIVEDRLILELKCVDAFNDEHLAQCLNYLRAANLPEALLINFKHPKVEWRRIYSPNH